VTYIDKNYKLSRWTLSDIMAHSLDQSGTPEENKFVQRLVDKLKYCKEVLVSIHTASSAEGAAPPSDAPMDMEMKSSKATLR
jgi:cell cycle serine/threonine-protein kinase CDC5/MSD2